MDTDASGPPMQLERRQDEAPGPVPEIIRFSGISRIFPGPPEFCALRPCDLGVRAGDFVTVVGPSGSGKSTLLNIMGLLDRPSDGTYILDDVDIGGLNEHERTRVRGQKIGFVFQSFQLLDHRTALENVMLSTLYQGVPVGDRRAKALEALELVGLPERGDSKPSRMSGGERQRVAIARALAGAPRLLLCDEPTGNLDSVNSDAILDLFVELNRLGTTIVLITHDAGVADMGNRKVTIRDGFLSEATLPVGGH